MKKIYHRILVVTLLFIFLNQYIAFSSSEKMNNFIKIRSYSPQTFNDINQSDWFYNEVVNSYCYGITNGTGDSTFDPYGLVSIAEAITFAVRVNSIYNSNAPIALPEQGQEWYEGNVSYAIKNGIIKDNMFLGEYTRQATRAEMSYIFANALSYTEYDNINATVETIPDMDSSAPYYNEILLLYKAGVIVGKDNYGQFYPIENITRAEASAILNRIIDPSQRKAFAPLNNTTKVDTAAIAKLAGPCMFKIDLYDKDGKTFSSGSGFFIEKDGMAVTNSYVIRDAYSAKITTTEGIQYKVNLVYGYDVEKDIAIIKVDGENFPTLKLADKEAVKNGQKILCMGSPLVSDNTITEGVVLENSMDFNEKKYIKISTAISNGRSGKVVLNENGEMIGIASSNYTKFVIPSDVIGTINRTDGKTLFQLFWSDKYYKESPDVLKYSYVTGTTEAGEPKILTSGLLYMYYYPYNPNNVKKYKEALINDGFVFVRRDAPYHGDESYTYAKGKTVVTIALSLNIPTSNFVYIYLNSPSK